MPQVKKDFLIEAEAIDGSLDAVEREALLHDSGSADAVEEAAQSLDSATSYVDQFVSRLFSRKRNNPACYYGFIIVLAIVALISIVQLSHKNGQSPLGISYDKVQSPQGTTSLRYHGKCIFDSPRIPCWYNVNISRQSALVTEVDLNSLHTMQLRKTRSGSYYYWQDQGVRSLIHPGATHEMALTYDESDNNSQPFMLLSQQLENALTLITFPKDWQPTDTFWRLQNITRFTFGDTLGPNATNIHKIVLDGLSDNIWWLMFESSSSVCRLNHRNFFRKGMIPVEEFITCWVLPYDDGYVREDDFGHMTYAALHTCVQDGTGDFWCALKFPNPGMAWLHQPWNKSYDGDRWTVWNFWKGRGSERWKQHFRTPTDSQTTRPLIFITATTPLYDNWDRLETRRYIWFNSITTGHVGWFDAYADKPTPKICPLHYPITGVTNDESAGDEERNEDRDDAQFGDWNTRPGGMVITDEGNALVVSYMPSSVLLKVNRNCSAFGITLNTGDVKYPILYIAREQYISEDEGTSLFLGSSTNDFSYVTLTEGDIEYPTEADAVIVVRNFTARNLTYNHVEIYETPSMGSWVHRVNLFTRFFKGAREHNNYAVYSTELIADHLMALAFTLQN